MIALFGATAATFIITVMMGLLALSLAIADYQERRTTGRLPT